MPDYRNVFLEGSSNAWQSIQAGIPNVEFETGFHQSGSFFAEDLAWVNEKEVKGAWADHEVSGVFKRSGEFYYYIDRGNDPEDWLEVNHESSDAVKEAIDFCGDHAKCLVTGENDIRFDYTYSFSYDASNEHNVYGRSNTVQPPTMTVKWMIKAK